MMHGTKYAIIHSTILGLISLIGSILIVSCSGCSNSSHTETVEVPVMIGGEEVIAKYTSESKQWLFLYFTSRKGLRNITPWSYFQMGETLSYPDPNAIEFVVEGAAISAGQILKGGV